jgi:hypothetical protein
LGAKGTRPAATRLHSAAGWILKAQNTSIRRIAPMFAAHSRISLKAGILAFAAAVMLAQPVIAQSVTTQPAPAAPVIQAQPVDSDLARSQAAPAQTPQPTQQSATLPQTSAGEPAATVPPVANSGATYQQDDIIGAAQGVFGKGAAGLAQIIQDLLKKQGQPNAYITGREAGGAVGIGVRYGSGTLHHKVEGERPVYWTGPSIGFDLGANAASTFVLVYNLYDTQDLYKRFGAGEGQAYLVGGFHVSYLRRGSMVLIPVRSGAGLRLGINAGWMKFSQKRRLLPF